MTVDFMRHDNQPGLSGTSCWVGGVDPLHPPWWWIMGPVCLLLQSHQLGRRATEVLVVSLEKKKSVGVDIVAIAD